MKKKLETREDRVKNKWIGPHVSTTGGEYFRAGSEKEFQEIFNRIDSLEKTKIDGRSYYEKDELYENILKIALLLLVIGAFFEYKKYIKIP